MRVTIITQGTQGDVQPYIALGQGLQQAGHQVTIATATTFHLTITAHGLNCAPLAGNPQEALDSFKEVADGGNPLKNLRYIRAMLPQMGLDMLAAAQRADLLVSNFNVSHLAYSVAERLGLPFVEGGLMPMLATRRYPNPHIWPTPPRLWPAALNQLTYAPVDQLLWQPFRTIINHFRQTHLKVPPYPLSGYAPLFVQRGIPRLEAYSRHLLPAATDWGHRVHTTGFWFGQRPPWDPPADLQHFLAQGPPPLYIGFGSMNFGDATARTHLLLAALRQTGQRAILALGWGGLETGAGSDTLFPLAQAPHDWLFPQVSAVIHHGGAGTTAAALRAGIPQLIIPFMGDQPFWGHRIAAHGLGPTPIPRKSLTLARLLPAIESLQTTPRFRQQAQLFSAKVQAEGGVAAAVAAIAPFLGASAG